MDRAGLALSARSFFSPPCRWPFRVVALAFALGGLGLATARGQGTEPRALVAPEPVCVPADFEGQIEHVVLQACRDTVGDLVPPYRGLLRSLPQEVQVTIVSDDDATVALLQARLGNDLHGPLGRVRFNVVNRGITVWARDRMIAARAVAAPERIVLIVPDVQNDVEIERLNDAEAIPGAVANLAPDRFTVQRVHLLIEGGNVLASRSHIFVGRNAINDNIRPSMPTPRAVRRALQDVFGKPVIVLGETFEEDLPSEHADMYLTIIDDRTVLVGRHVDLPPREGQPPAPPEGDDRPRRMPAMARDPAAALLERNPYLTPFALPARSPRVLAVRGWVRRCTWEDEPLDAPFGQDLDPLRDPCDLVAQEMAGRGFRVLRVPIHPDRGGADFVTFNNALVEERNGRKIAYVPSYGLPSLEREARRVYTHLGFQVRLIDVRAIHRLEGTVRCLANVIERRDGGGLPQSRPASRPAHRGAAVAGRGGNDGGTATPESAAAVAPAPPAPHQPSAASRQASGNYPLDFRSLP